MRPPSRRLCLVLALAGAIFARPALAAEDDLKAQARTVGASLRAMQEGQLKNPGAPVDTRPAATGKMGEAEAVTRRISAKVVADRQALDTATAQLGLSEAMRPQQLTTAAGRAHAMDVYRQASLLIEKCRAAIHSDMLTIDQEVEKTSLSAGEKKAFLSGVAHSMQASMAELDRYFDLQRGVGDQMQALVGLLDRTAGHWSLDNGKFSFSREADTAEFFNILSRLQALIAETNELSRQMIDDSLKSDDKLAHAAD